ncbi:hypothetical protein L7F22_055125 [Adiantum nelumboides]|nr:hypothetical protein [Adiantum nelumboides]
MTLFPLFSGGSTNVNSNEANVHPMGVFENVTDQSITDVDVHDVLDEERAENEQAREKESPEIDFDLPHMQVGGVVKDKEEAHTLPVDAAAESTQLLLEYLLGLESAIVPYVGPKEQLVNMPRELATFEAIPEVEISQFSPVVVDGDKFIFLHDLEKATKLRIDECLSLLKNSQAPGLPQPIPKELNNANPDENRATNGLYLGSQSVSSSNKQSFPNGTDSPVSKSPHPQRTRKFSASRLTQPRLRYNDSTSVEESGSEAELSKSLVRKSFGYTRSFSSKYELGSEVGRGHFGYTCYASLKGNGEFQEPTVAVKIIPKTEMRTSRDVQDVEQEVKILKALSGHSNLIQFHEVFEDIDRVYIVMELCTGGELLQQILDRGGRYAEEEAKAIISQMLSAVAFIHLQGVVHRDLKPENFLFKNQDKWPLMKVIDFGLSDYVRPDERLKDIVGSAYYVAPEVLEQSYGTEADIWSVGVIAYILLSGNRPFWARTESGIFAAVTHTEPDFDEDPWPSISVEAKDFTEKLLKKDPQKRLTAAQSLGRDLN